MVPPLQVRHAVPRIGLAAKVRGRSLQDVAKDALAVARKGLGRRARKDAEGRDEARHLAALEEIAASGRPLAADLLARYETRWGGSVLPAFKECVF